MYSSISPHPKQLFCCSTQFVFRHRLLFPEADTGASVTESIHNKTPPSSVSACKGASTHTDDNASVAETLDSSAPQSVNTSNVACTIDENVRSTRNIVNITTTTTLTDTQEPCGDNNTTKNSNNAVDNGTTSVERITYKRQTIFELEGMFYYNLYNMTCARKCGELRHMRTQMWYT